MNTEFCPICDSPNTFFADQDIDKGLECRMCGDCGEVWWNNENEPSDDCFVIEGEPINPKLLRHIERYSMHGRQPNDQN